MSPKPRTPHSEKSTCPVAHALDIIGDSWTLIVMRDMAMFNKHEFKDFMQAAEGIATNTLTDRLKRLECVGLIKQMPHPTHKTRKLYYLTESGKDFIHVLVSLAAWSDKNLPRVNLPAHLHEKLQNAPEKISQYALTEILRWEEKYLA